MLGSIARRLNTLNGSISLAITGSQRCTIHSSSVLNNYYAKYVPNSKKKRERKRIDEEDFTWMEPLQKYKAEKLAEKDMPEKEPHLLHVVTLAAQVPKTTWWEKKILVEYGLFEKYNYRMKKRPTVVLKNIPSVNSRLDLIKHLVEIKPLTCPGGLPVTVEDARHFQINSNGELVQRQHFIEKTEEQKKLEEGDPVEKAKDRWRMKSTTLYRDCDWRKVHNELYSDHVEPDYKFRYNQDSKELRYSFNKPEAIGRDVYRTRAPKRIHVPWSRPQLGRSYR